MVKENNITLTISFFLDGPCAVIHSLQKEEEKRD